VGSIFWAIFVDAIAYHHGRDVVRPAFDYAVMFLVLGGLPPLAHPRTTGGPAGEA
jgi:hypothetical protein